MSAFVLVHSPLVGPLTWQPVAYELRARDVTAIAPALPPAAWITPPYWKAHAEAVARAISEIPPDEPVMLVGHSGGGMILPAIRQVAPRPVAGYIFADAGIPRDGKSRLNLFDPDEVKHFRAAAIDDLIPPWNEEDLAGVLPDMEVRRRFVAELLPVPLAIYEEPLQVFDDWPDAPCAYLHFSPVYDPVAEEARRAGWLYRRLDAGHFHMLVDPEAVADALLDLASLLLRRQSTNS